MTLGNVVFFGSGETSPTGGLVFQKTAAGFGKGFRIALLETPAGFEPNSAQVAGRVAEFLRLKLDEKKPRVQIIPARRKGTPFGPDSPGILEPVIIADWIYFGAGSPSYTVRQLRDSLAWRMILAAWQQGATLVLASAAMVAMGSSALPVYEIFKAGDDPHWIAGLDLFAPLGWKTALVPHWNNAEGGEELDTSRCFMGRERFRALLETLPPGTAVLGIDELTTLTLDWARGLAVVDGKGSATLLRDGTESVHPSGEAFPLAAIGAFAPPASIFGVDETLWEEVGRRRGRRDAEPEAPPDVQALVAERERRRKAGDFAEADAIRVKLEGMGWSVRDTPQGPAVKQRSAD